MRHPYGRCEECGERLYQRVSGGYVCLNCGETYPESHFEADATESNENDDLQTLRT